jgi:hypothetical protein
MRPGEVIVTGDDSAAAAAMVESRFRAVNGSHPMSPADDAYVTAHFVSLEELCLARGLAPDEVRARILASELPLPGYVRSDGAQMVPRDYFHLASQAGGTERLREWFLGHWTDQQHAAEEWQSYVDGQYVCLFEVTPSNMQRKDWLSAQIRGLLDKPDDSSATWLSRLHALASELDGLTMPFTAYDRLRFGGRVSRDVLIDEVRQRYPQPGPA